MYHEYKELVVGYRISVCMVVHLLVIIYHPVVLQMLTMRNGSSSHPFYLPQAVQPPSVGPLDEANSSRVGSFTTDQEASMQAMFNLSSKPVSSDYKLLMARMSDDNNSGQACVPESSMTLQYRPCNASMPSKVLLLQPL